MRRWLAALAMSAIFLLPMVPRSAADDLGSVQEQFEAGQYGDAMTALRALISQNPRDAALHYWMGRCYYEVRDYDNSVTQFEKATALAPQSSVYHDWLGRAYGDKADRDHSFLLARRVKKEFQAAVRLDPSNLEARRNLEDFLLEAPWIVGGDKDDALKQVEAIAKINPLAGHLARADYYIHLGQNQQAVAEYNAVLAAKPDKVGPYFEIADYYGKQGNGPQIESIAQEAAQVDPQDPRLKYYRGEARVLEGTELNLAEEELKAYLATTPQRSGWPSHAAARYWLGRLYEKEGKDMEAAQQFSAALQLDPGRRDAKQALARLKKSIH